MNVVSLSVDKIRTNPDQPRVVFDPKALKELSQSIREHGVIQPLVVQQVSDDFYSIVAGERRYRAACMAGLAEVPCIIQSMTEYERMQIALIENIQREDLNPIEEAKAYRKIMSAYDLSQEEVASRVGKSRSAVANAVRLLSLPDDVQEKLEDGTISAGHARALLSVVNPAEREMLFKLIIDKHLSVRQAEDQASKFNHGGRAVNERKARKDREREADEISQEVLEKFTGVFGTKVLLKGRMEKGKLVVPFEDDGDLENIYRRLSGGKELFEEE